MSDKDNQEAVNTLYVQYSWSFDMKEETESPRANPQAGEVGSSDQAKVPIDLTCNTLKILSSDITIFQSMNSTI